MDEPEKNPDANPRPVIQYRNPAEEPKPVSVWRVFAGTAALLLALPVVFLLLLAIAVPFTGPSDSVLGLALLIPVFLLAAWVVIGIAIRQFKRR